jgi:hypothetical protein
LIQGGQSVIFQNDSNLDHYNPMSGNFTTFSNNTLNNSSNSVSLIVPLSLMYHVCKLYVPPFRVNCDDKDLLELCNPNNVFLISALRNGIQQPLFAPVSQSQVSIAQTLDCLLILSSRELLTNAG